ncbi:MAG: NAD(P)-binding domain-containing protein [Minicystis sp.]
MKIIDWLPPPNVRIYGAVNETEGFTMSKLKIGVLGTGDVGRVLASGFAALGHEVKLGSRDAANPKAVEWAAKHGANASAGTFADAAKFADVIIISTLWEGTKNAIELAGIDNFAGKIVIDTTNPLDFSKGAPPTLAVGTTDSGGEQIQRLVPKAHVVKCFNIVGNPHMVNPSFPDGKPAMFICGDNEDAKKTVTDLCTALGWPGTVDIGGILGSRYLEPMAMVWISYYFKTGSGNHALALVRK